MNEDITPFLTYVRSEALYSLKEGFGYFTPATVFAISSAKGDVVKFNLLADDQVYFSNIDLTALSNDKTAPKLTQEECYFDACPDDDFSINQYEFLSTIEDCFVWSKNKTILGKGTYIFSIKWKSGSEMHLIELYTGNYILWDSKFITWGDEPPEKLPFSD